MPHVMPDVLVDSYQIAKKNCWTKIKVAFVCSGFQVFLAHFAYVQTNGFNRGKEMWEFILLSPKCFFSQIAGANFQVIVPILNANGSTSEWHFSGPFFCHWGFVGPCFHGQDLQCRDREVLNLPLKEFSYDIQIPCRNVLVAFWLIEWLLIKFIRAYASNYFNGIN